ncbi:HAD family hydrolase [Frondihabitans australicus]|uniref:Cof subfamily protein (Haloacid dehalogenase superfamily)/HAD superfamily hydrolase (TIGR01484 family) n=1 Tax=Frondihabitans australicus TaxID=386892 RepID=A0A495IJX0_9MICO|nr:HAD family hydrolase [Frondihabitans australicus]RKR76273.1 Cof subfamily protein (haloacid dehalogenase superfamily)/HAD superfamily hydrolase (TIGR01484 family) [Frondihabitans australicus]
MTSQHVEVGAGSESPTVAGAAPVEGARLRDDAWLVALDVDGTIMLEGGEIPSTSAAEISRLHDAGHQVMIATGRSVAFTLPVMERLGLVSDYVVCSNGAITLGRDDTSETGYREVYIEEFDPGEVLRTINDRLADASYAVEDAAGQMFYKGTFPSVALTDDSHSVTFDELCGISATRVVVLSPSHSQEEFLGIVESMGLHKVSYNVGWTAWLDIAPFGVTKATALERVRLWLGGTPARTMAVGDGRNDIDMLQWASRGGRGVAMGQAPSDVIDAANEVTGADRDGGLGAVLATLR